MNKIVNKLIHVARKARFASFVYTNSAGERSRYKIKLGFSYINLVNRSIDELNSSMENMQGDSKEAAKSLLESLQETAAGNNTNYTKKELYKPFLDTEGKVVHGIKVNTKNNNIHVCGLLGSKTVLDGGPSRAKSVSLKQAIRNSLPVGNFREFVLENISEAKLDGEVLTLTKN